jgi:hypothetical protein
MNDFDLIILMVYLTCVVMVFGQAVRSLQNQVRILVNYEALAEVLEQYGLTDTVRISFTLRPTYGFEPLHVLPIEIRNLSDTLPLYIDWDYCAITDIKGQARRAIRLPAGLPIDLSQAQVPSIIHPGQALNEVITSESTFQRIPQESGNALQNVQPLVNLAIAQNMEMDEHRTFSVQLLIRQPDSPRFPDPNSSYLVNCLLTIRRVDWVERVPLVQFIQNLRPSIPPEVREFFSLSRLLWALLIGVAALVVVWLAQ